MAERFYVTTPIYYVNDKPHIGHAYCTVLADAARRWHALLGAETFFVTGTDEHGQKVEQAAGKRGLEPQAHCDELHQKFKDLWPELHCAPDQFIRTTEPRHIAVVQRALSQLHAQGLIEARDFEGWYCTADERFWTEKELKEGNCPDCGRQVSRLTERNWFFLMSRFQQPLIDAIRSGRMQIVPANRANEVLGFLAQPLQDLCISRPRERLKWGIPLPFDDRFVCYVWFDALLNYVTAVGGFDADSNAPGGFDAWWPHVTHFLGKDILTTHAVYWPTMLLALGLPLPKRLVTTGWWLQGDAKMSKSLGNVVSPLDMKDRYGAEVLRYFLLREIPFGSDGSFSYDALIGRYNSDLANGLGNLASRTLALIQQNCDGKIPAGDGDPEIVAAAAIAVDNALDSYEQLNFSKALETVWGFIGALDKFIVERAPWKLAKSGETKLLHDTLYTAAEALRLVTALVSPVIPESAAKIWAQLGFATGLDAVRTDDLVWGKLPAGQNIVNPSGVFPRADLKIMTEEMKQGEAAELARQKELLGQTAAPVEAAPAAPAAPQMAEGVSPIAPEITIDDFVKIDLRVGLIKTAEKVKGADKLLHLSVDIGEPEPRSIVAGIALAYQPEQLINRKVAIVANLAPRKLRGLTSQGMIVAASLEGGSPVLAGYLEDVPVGARLK